MENTVGVNIKKKTIKKSSEKKRRVTISQELIRQVHEIKESLFVESRNGVVRRKHLSEMIIEINDRVKEAELKQINITDNQKIMAESQKDMSGRLEMLTENTQFLIDFNKVHKIFKKYHIYKVIIIGVVIVLLTTGVEWIKGILKLL